MDKKKLYILLKIACIVLLPIIFYSFASYRSKNRKIKEIQINYTNLVSNSHSFLEDYRTEYSQFIICRNFTRRGACKSTFYL